jgi:hypothetical protein
MRLFFLPSQASIHLKQNDFGVFNAETAFEIPLASVVISLSRVATRCCDRKVTETWAIHRM